jgi:hypothetical protein
MRSKKDEKEVEDEKRKKKKEKRKRRSALVCPVLSCIRWSGQAKDENKERTTSKKKVRHEKVRNIELRSEELTYDRKRIA